MKTKSIEFVMLPMLLLMMMTTTMMVLLLVLMGASDTGDGNVLIQLRTFVTIMVVVVLVMVVVNLPKNLHFNYSSSVKICSIRS